MVLLCKQKLEIAHETRAAVFAKTTPGRECALPPAVGMGISENAVNWMEMLVLMQEEEALKVLCKDDSWLLYMVR